jgi:hypothetical protein
MADRVIERTETEAPRDTVVVHDDRDRRSGLGPVVAVILIILLLLFFGSLIFGGGGDGDSNVPTTNTNIQTPAPTGNQ